MRTMPCLRVKNCNISTWRKDKACRNQQASNYRKETPNLITAFMGRLDNRIQGKMNKIIVLNEIQMKQVQRQFFTINIFRKSKGVNVSKISFYFL